MQEQRVEFFNSQSSFSTESALNNSRYLDLSNQLFETVDNIFNTLNKQFLPTQQLTNYDKIDYLINRANILFNDTIPQHLSYLTKIQAPQETKQNCKKCSEKLRKLLQNYTSLKEGSLLHKQFYNIYGRNLKDHIFFKSIDRSQIYEGQNKKYLNPDVVEYVTPNKGRLGTSDYKLSARGNLYGSQVATKYKQQKQITQLEQQITQLKRRQKQLIQQNQQNIAIQRLNCQKRIRSFMQILNNKISLSQNNNNIQELILKYKNQKTYIQTNLFKIMQENKQLFQEKKKLQNKIQQIKKQNQSLSEQLIHYRKLQNSRMQDFQNMTRSVHSVQEQSYDQKQHQTNKELKKITGEKNLLKSQLLREREKFSQQITHTNQNFSKQINRLKKNLENRNNEIQNLQRQYDQLRVQNVQTLHQKKLLKKQVSSLKQEIQELKVHLPPNYVNNDNFALIGTYKQNPSSTQSRVNKNLLGNSIFSSKIGRFEAYEGQGIEGYPYYELLSKQLKVRFRRACLKSKQLLYKGNSIQLGIISQFQSPNIIKLYLHLTNSDNINLQNIKFKLMNPNQNKIQTQLEQIDLININQQIKIPITCSIKNYPIGPVVLSLEYMAEEKHDLRILLPVHIFKMVEIKDSNEKMLKPNQLIFRVEKKICKNISMLKEYFGSIKEGNLKVEINHQHSNSTLLMEFKLFSEELQILYEQVKGQPNFAKYFIKTLQGILQKH